MTATTALTRLAAPLGPLAIVLVLGSLAIAGGRATWHIAGYSAVTPDLPDPADAASPVAPAPPDVAPILALAPFGSVEIAAPAPAAVGETTLDLVLRGVTLSERPAESFALIADQGQTLNYAPGDTVAGRAVLVTVAVDHVILDVDGVAQTLSFPDPDLAAAGAAPAALSGVDRLREAIGGQTSAAPPPAAEAAPQTTQDYIALWRQRLTANPSEVLDAIGLIATADGYMIAEEHDSGVRLAGLRAGDLVKSVNGQAVGNVERDRQLYDEVAASGLARIEVVRDGRTILMSFPLE